MKLKMHTPALTAENIEKLAALFPNCVTETKDEATGKLKRAIDFDQLRQELSDHIVEGPRERYHLDWPGKREALLAANAPIAKTLRPCREESVDFDTTKNLFIQGDNLDALKLLQETYLGKVKMIYIDPPYNTGNDFIYEDDFAENAGDYITRSNQEDESGNRMVSNPEANGRFHSDWMTMLYSRLRLARNLLRDDGLIFISIDEGEQSNLRLMCDEIFGSDNFVEAVTWKKRYGAGGGTKGFAKLHDYILVYSKTQIENIEAPLSEEQIAAYTLKDENYVTRGGYVTQPLATSSKGERSNLMYVIHHEGAQIRPKKGTRWIWSEEKFLEAYKQGQIVINSSGSGYSVRFKQYLKDEKGKIRNGKPLSIHTGVFNQDGTDELVALFGQKGVFDFPKPTKLLKFFFSFIVNDGSDRDFIVLDFFAGSSTTADSVMQLNALDGGNRKWVCVQIDQACPEGSEAQKLGYKTIAEIGKERIRRAGAKILKEWEEKQVAATPKKQKEVQQSLCLVAEDPSSFNIQPSSFALDIGFRVLKIDTSNMADVYYAPDAVKQADLWAHTDNIKPDRTPEDLLFQVLVDWGVDLSLPISKESFEIGKERKDEGTRMKVEGKSGGEAAKKTLHPSSINLQPFSVFFVDGNALAACFDANITEELVKEIARRKPLRAVFRDSSFDSDSTKINVEQIFKLLSPETEVKTL